MAVITLIWCTWRSWTFTKATFHIRPNCCRCVNTGTVIYRYITKVMGLVRLRGSITRDRMKRRGRVPDPDCIHVPFPSSTSKNEELVCCSAVRGSEKWNRKEKVATDADRSFLLRLRSQTSHSTSHASGWNSQPPSILTNQ